MPTWVTLKNGNKIDLDQLDSNKGFNDALRDSLSISSIREISLPKEEYAMVMSNINNYYYHVNKTKIKGNTIGYKAIGDYVYVFKIGKFNSQKIIAKLPINNYEEDNEVN